MQHDGRIIDINSLVSGGGELFKCKLGGLSNPPPLGQIAHPLQEFRPNGLIDYFSLFYGL